VQRLKQVGRWGARLLVFGALLQLALTFLGLPGPLVNWMQCTPPRDQPAPPPPQYIVVLGGGGIPSASGLTRTFHAAELWQAFPAARCVVSLPADGDPATSSVGRMRDELVRRGVPAEAIALEWRAVNTHQQAVNVATLLGPAALTAEVRVVTNPWHLRRALGCFRRAGFVHARADGAAGIGAEADPGGGTFLRYEIWANAEATIECLRELCALLLYRLRGWI
jgi:uncharacterized SAM-binding protein YcdF (DUF218 family)